MICPHATVSNRGVEFMHNSFLFRIFLCFLRQNTGFFWPPPHRSPDRTGFWDRFPTFTVQEGDIHCLLQKQRTRQKFLSVFCLRSWEEQRSSLKKQWIPELHTTVGDSAWPDHLYILVYVSSPSNPSSVLSPTHVILCVSLEWVTSYTALQL